MHRFSTATWDRAQQSSAESRSLISCVPGRGLRNCIAALHPRWHVIHEPAALNMVVTNETCLSRLRAATASFVCVPTHPLFFTSLCQVAKHYRHLRDAYCRTEAETPETEPECWPPYVRVSPALSCQLWCYISPRVPREAEATPRDGPARRWTGRSLPRSRKPTRRSSLSWRALSCRHFSPHVEKHLFPMETAAARSDTRADEETLRAASQDDGTTASVVLVKFLPTGAPHHTRTCKPNYSVCQPAASRRAPDTANTRPPARATRPSLGQGRLGGRLARCVRQVPPRVRASAFGRVPGPQGGPPGGDGPDREVLVR